MSDSKDASQGGADQAQKPFMSGLETSMWADANFNPRQTSKKSRSTYKPVLHQPEASHKTAMAPWFPNAPTKENWDADLKKSQWATRDEGALPVAGSSPAPSTHSSSMRSTSAIGELSAIKNLNPTVEDARTSDSDITLREDTKALDKASATPTADAKTEFLAELDRLAKQYNMSASQVADLVSHVSVAGYGNVEQLGAGEWF